MRPIGLDPWNTEPPLGPRSLHDETLRDGLQACAVTDPPLDEKRHFIRNLHEAGITSACLGLPAAGPRAVFDTIGLLRTISEERLRVRPVLAGRTCQGDVDAIVHVADAAGVEVEATLFVGASPIRTWVEGWTVSDLRRWVIDAVERADAAGISCTLVLEDSTRTPPEVLANLFGAGLEAGARRLVLCDTVGCATPAGAAALATWARRFAGRSTGLDWHGHDDRGLAVACAIAAAEAGCDRIHGCVGGVGERVGNADLQYLAAELSRRGAGSWHAEPLHRARTLVDTFSQAPRRLSAAS